MSRRLDGKVALITGGANGIGLACALRFADEGAAIVVADVLDDAGSKAVAAVAEHGAEGLFVHLDASRAEENHAVVKTAVERFGGLDILVTAAGILHAAQRSGDIGNDTEYVKTHRAELGQPGAALAALTIDEWRRVIDVNLTGTMLAVQATAASMIQTGRSGSIITISSIGGKHPGAGSFAYSVSKAGVWMFTKSAARDLASAGIRVNAIGPGFIQTNMTAAVFELEAVRSAVLAQVPMGRLGRPEDIANAALFLASDESSYMTGEILHPDGGFYTE
jgi:NAD(P)-dependent dehydrogenase (short-subunit alcohol dehydrogenase family)